MENAPLISIVHSIILLPIAVLFAYALIGGIKKWKHHSLVAAIALVIDLTVSVLYLLNRLLGDKFADSQADFTGWLLVYIIIHGIIASIVVLVEFVLLAERMINHRKNPKNKFHSAIVKVFAVLWTISFLSGEFYFTYVYLL
ncbi:MAG: hypothetical protein K0R00_2413 [Herbinix sp.]|jgi:hypothetical protein|nr:hypothetical protein [Herbinix sp.]